MSALFIDDGFTAARTLPARPGFHPEVLVEYRPALAKERLVYGSKAKGDPGTLDTYECDLLRKYVVTLNGAPLPPNSAARLHPLVRADVIDLILSVTPSDEAERESKSSGA